MPIAEDVMPDAERHGIATPEVVSWLASQPKGEVKRSGFYRWVRGLTPPEDGSEHEWSPMRRGAPVRLKTLVLLQKWLLQVKGYAPAGKFAEDAKAPPKPDALKEADLWGSEPASGWSRFMTQLSEQFVPPASARCGGSGGAPDSTVLLDIQTAAATCIEWIGGLSAGKRKVTDAEAREIGEREMGRTTAAFAEWLLPIWRLDPHAILFPTVGGKRVGVSIILPLTTESYSRFRRGETWDFHLNAADLEVPSRTLLLFMVAESRGRGLPKGKERRLAQLNTAAYQMAAFHPRRSDTTCRPSVLCIAGTSEAERWLAGFGFTDIGVQMPHTPRKLYELTEGGHKTVAGRANYISLCGALEVFQSFLSAEHAAMDDGD